MSDERATEKPIHVLHFDEDGCGPSDVHLCVRNLAGYENILDNCGIEVTRGGFLYKPILGGFMLSRDDAQALHDQIGRWLADHDAGKGGR